MSFLAINDIWIPPKIWFQYKKRGDSLLLPFRKKINSAVLY